MQRVFLTERETGDKHPCQTSSAMVLDEGTEGNDASVATSSSLATDAAVASSSDPQADRSDEVILPTHTVMNTCDWETLLSVTVAYTDIVLMLLDVREWSVKRSGWTTYMAPAPDFSFVCFSLYTR